jgi:hypothetical protein
MMTHFNVTLPPSHLGSSCPKLGRNVAGWRNGNSVQSNVHLREAVSDSRSQEDTSDDLGKHGGLFAYLFFVQSRSCFLSRLLEAALPAAICSGRFLLLSCLVPHSLIDTPGRPPHPVQSSNLRPQST